jgi:hypothetical protein
LIAEKREVNKDQLFPAPHPRHNEDVYKLWFSNNDANDEVAAILQ